MFRLTHVGTILSNYDILYIIKSILPVDLLGIYWESMNDFFKIDPSSGNIILTKALDNQTTKFDFILHAGIYQRNLFNVYLLTENLNYILESV
jgi:hypothetical protein